MDPTPHPEPLYSDGRQSAAALDIARGTLRLLRAHGLAGFTELSLGNGRRADICAVSAVGDVWIVEIKSSLVDFQVDRKWPQYRDYCDRLLFAVAADFPADVLPADCGLIVADRFGAELIRAAPEHRLAAARRKTLLIAVARAACLRLQGVTDPDMGVG